MTTEAPKIDPRTARNIAEEVQQLLKVYAPAWNEVDASGQAAGMSGALIGIFSRFAEIIIQRLNRAPQKNFLAFLDLLGGALLPPQPARVPLTFSLAAGSPVDGIVPAGTRVAAPPGEGETEPVLYETERQLVVTAAQLDALFVLDPEQDLYADLGALLTAPVADGRPLFEGDPERPIDHIFYLGDLDFFNLAHLSQVQLKLSFDRAVADELEIRWERRDAAGWTEIETLADITDDKLRTFDFGGLPTIDPSRVAGVESRWVRGRLLTPITLSPVEREGRVRAERLPTITACELTGEIGAEVAVERSFTNQFAIDPSTIFAPFGEKPKLGDAWLIGQREAFSQAGAGITLKLHIANEVQTDGKPKLTWEFWDGKSWQALKPTAGTPQAGQVQDNTADLTKSGDAEVKLQLPGPSVARELNGVSSSWLRVRLTGGNYGQEARYEKRVINGSEGFVVVEAPSFKPPLISSMTISYAGTVSADRIVLRAENDFVFESPANGRLKPFRPADEREPTFYLGVTLPPGGRPPRRALSLYFGLVEPLFGNASTSVNERPELKAEYWNGRDWQVLLVDDGTTSLTRPGIVEFQPPADFAAREEFGLARHWVRVRWVKGAYRFKPRARRLLLNTTMALQAVTLNNEVLGSSDGGKDQKFRATQTPILLGQRLEVRELEMPSAAELEVLAREEDGEAMTLVLDAAGNPTEIWVRWHETPDFYGSGPRSRHYVLDHLTGEIRFGDGLNGLIPPIGSGNLRLAHYQTGGGSAGNRPAGAIIQMKTTVPYVHAVTNPEAALGGAEAEGLKSLLARAPRTLRHHGRAVTTEDYEDLALLASSEVARARCVPLRNLIDTPLMSEALEAHPINSLGEVSVIIVPRSTAPKPLPSLELIRRVQEYLEAHSVPTANLRVTGPLYLRVNVEVDVVPVSIEGAGAVAQAVQQSLADFLHPLTGGLDEQGWEFGREPHQSDLYALIESVPGVDHVHRLREPLREVDERDRIALKIDPGGAGAAQIIKDTGRFLVYSGTHTVNLRFEE